MTLTPSDIALLREFPASAEAPQGLTPEQRRRVEDLPWGLLRNGRRTDLGDDVIAMADRIAALEVEHAATLSASVRDVDVEEVLADADALSEAIEGGDHYERDALRERIVDAAPALARKVARLRDALATAEAERDELRLTLAAERGQAEGAPHPDWRYDAGTWERYYDDGDSAIVYSDGTWARGPFGECARHKGRAPNRRAAMLAADAALSGEATTSPSALAPQGSQTPQ